MFDRMNQVQRSYEKQKPSDSIHPLPICMTTQQDIGDVAITEHYVLETKRILQFMRHLFQPIRRARGIGGIVSITLERY